MAARPEKQAMVAEIRGLLGGAEYVFLVDFRGLTVEQLAELRARLRVLHGSLKVVRNSFLALAAAGVDWDDMSGVEGSPTAVIAGSGDACAVAKALDEYVRREGAPQIKGGRIGTEGITADAVLSMAKLPPRDVLLGRAVGTIAAPMSQLVGVMTQKMLSLLYVLRAAGDKKSSHKETR